ncbi:MAG: hypothetical protein E7646_04635 [Ruminococcaceae bacterium]|nr:hypothetical protein [Oscillospiraceae bacterium]
MFKAGFARVDVTPPLGTELTGYFEKRYSDGVLDPVELNALAINDGEKSAIIITSDFMYCPEKPMLRFRTLVSQKTSVDINSIFIQSVHQHTSTTAGIDGPTDPDYQILLEKKYCDVAVMALEDMKEAEISIAQKEAAVPLSFIRRYKMKDGSTRTNPGLKRMALIDSPIGKADNTVRIVKLSREGAKDIALVNFQTHPDVIGGNKFSADWPGFTRRFCEKDLDNVHCILVNGCQGDVNHINLFDLRTGYSHSKFMGRTIADTVIEMWNNTEKTDAGSITTDVLVKRIPSNTEGIEKVDECIKIYSDYQAGKLEEHISMNELGEIRRISQMDELNVLQRVPVSIVAFGKVVLIGYGGEPFTEYADKLREAFPELHIMTACLANGAQGYLPSVSAFEEGGYESRTTNFTKTVAPVLQQCAIDMIKDHISKA